MKAIPLYQAIAMMRRMSAEGKPFSFAHFTWDEHRRKGEGLRVVNRAILRPSAKDDDVKHASFKLFYTDLDAKKPRNCWQPLLAYFNGMRIQIKGYENSSRR